MLCSCCQSLFAGDVCIQPRTQGNHAPAYSNRHHDNVGLLRQSAQEGCQLCVLVCNAPEFDVLDSDLPVYFELCRAKVGYTIVFEIDERRVQWIDLIPVTGDDLMFEPKSFELSTGSDASLETASQWLENCVRHHERCQARTKIGWHPKRLLDVGLHTGCDIHLLESPELGPEEKYFTLSHCWGKTSHVALTTANLESFKQRVPLESLSKTFLDAIHVSRFFGIRYLWIDSLCIIQDSAEDWLQESAQMHNVYSYSYLNISATISSDGDGGCFRDRNPFLVQPVIVQTTWAAGDPNTYVCTEHNLWSESVDNEVLNQRGWVLQERFLAPRILHFAAHQLFWECMEGHKCESLPYASVSQISKPRLIKVVNPAEDFPRLREEHLAKDGVIDPRPEQEQANDAIIGGYSLWNDLVEVYSDAKLSVPSDKLIAFSGIAKELRIHLQDEYFAGLWKRHMIHHLLWKVWGSMEVRPVYRAPTWSWASVDGFVFEASLIPRVDGKDLLASVQDVKVTTVGDDDTGAVKAGYLRIKGQLARASLERRHRSQSISENGLSSGSVDEDSKNLKTDIEQITIDNAPYAIFSCGREATAEELEGDFFELTVNGIRVEYSPALDITPPSESNKTDVHCLLLKYMTIDDDRGGLHPQIMGLILEPTGIFRGQFRRIGMFQISYLEEVEYLLRGVGYDVEYEKRTGSVDCSFKIGEKEGYVKWKAEECPNCGTEIDISLYLLVEVRIRDNVTSGERLRSGLSNVEFILEKTHCKPHGLWCFSTFCRGIL